MQLREFLSARSATESTDRASAEISVSIVVPVYNRAGELARCLAALREQRGVAFEIIVVDDGSTDDSASVARSYGARVERLARRCGAAIARNHGVRAARGQTILFVDSDVLAPPTIAQRACATLTAHPEYDAVFGSYDAKPFAKGTVSVFRNLLHHYTHQNAGTEAVTFWAGCGAIRKSAFDTIGGFDPAWECIEDIELGYRLREHGRRILLDHEMQATHTKRWTLGSMLTTDFRGRAVPWSRLILARGEAPDALNVRAGQRVSVALAALVLVALAASLLNPAYLGAAFAAWAPIVWINRDFYDVLARSHGLGLALAGLPLHLLYFATAGLGFVYAWGERAFARGRAHTRKNAPAAQPLSTAHSAATLEIRAEAREP